MSQVPWFIDLCGILGTVPLFSPVAVVADTLSNQFLFWKDGFVNCCFSCDRGACDNDTTGHCIWISPKHGVKKNIIYARQIQMILRISFGTLCFECGDNTEIQNFFTQDQLIIVFSFGVVHLSIFHTSSLMTCELSDPGDLQERLQDMSTQREELLHQTAKSMARELQLGIPRWHGDCTGWRTSNIRNFQWKLFVLEKTFDVQSSSQMFIQFFFPINGRRACCSFRSQKCHYGEFMTAFGSQDAYKRQNGW